MRLRQGFRIFQPRFTTLGIRELVILVLFTTATGTDDLKPSESQIPFKQHPLSNPELYKVLRQHYKFQDFLWAGSGDGPVPSTEESQDGMAWEDETPHDVGQIPIKVTKTMVLYKTVLSTIYPVALTPTVVTSRISPTPTLQIVQTWDISSTKGIVVSTATLQTSMIVVQPTVTFTTTPSMSFTTEHPNTSNNDRLSAFESDPRFWIQTSIRKKRGDDKFHPNDLGFQELLQGRLAQVYAIAFKRQLLRSLRIMEQHGEISVNGSSNLSKIWRARRSLDYEDVEMDPLYHYLRSESEVVRTVMNVSVSMVNVTWSDDRKSPQVDLKYIVYAEGKPVQGFVAVKELQIISKDEMEKKLGYEIVNKAEALIQPLERSEIGAVGSTTPWLIALLSLVCVMIMILILTLFMAWKWRNNRLRDRNEQYPSVPETGLSRQPREGRPGKIDAGQERARQHQVRSPESGSPSMLSSHLDEEEVPQGPSRPLGVDERLLESADRPSQYRDRADEEIPSSAHFKPHPSDVSSYHSHSPRRRQKKPSAGVARKVNRRRRSRPRKSHEVEEIEEEAANIGKAETPKGEQSEEDRDFGFPLKIQRNLDKISFGNLEIYKDSDTRVPSAHAKRILSRPSSSSEPRKAQEPIPSTSAQAVEKEEEEEGEISEHSFDAEESPEGEKRDAEVQTPTRLKRARVASRGRGSPRHRGRKAQSSRVSLLSTESEDFMNLPSSSEEINPIRRIRKRFHQFLDDAFNVMGMAGQAGTAESRKRNAGKVPQSAKVTVSHEVKSKTTGRPWTSHVIREESFRKIRPKSSVMMRPPKAAWTTGPEPRRCQSAKSKTSVINEEGDESYQNEGLEEADDVSPGEERRESQHAITSSRASTPRNTSFHSNSSASHYIFPKYPTYPEIDLSQDNQPRWAGPGPSRPQLHPSDPAVPLIAAIKDEMKKFEKVKPQGSKNGTGTT